MKNEIMKNRDCDDPKHQQEVLLRHSITKIEFDNAARSFFQPSPIDPPLVVTAARISNLIQDADCKKNCLLLQGSSDLVSGNSDISIQIINTPSPVAPPVIPASVCVLYSMLLFKAVLNIHKPDTFSFSKAISGSNPAIIFYVGNSGSTVYVCDLSDVYP